MSQTQNISWAGLARSGRWAESLRPASAIFSLPPGPACPFTGGSLQGR